MTNTTSHPLMDNNISRSDLEALIVFLSSNPRLTQGDKVKQFESEWSQWLGIKHSLFVNSGSSANLLTMTALKHHFGEGEVIVPPLTWVSDIASVLQSGLEPVFVDINPNTLGIDEKQLIAAISPRTKAVFLTHVLGYNALTESMLDILRSKGILLIEDVCESHGATFKGAKLGSHGFASNFSFYFAHHMSTIEGGMICTNSDEFYQTLRMLRSHGMVRESSDEQLKQKYNEQYPDLSPDFTFAFPAYNVRSTEINAVIGLSQLPKLDNNNLKRRENLSLFLENLDSTFFKTDFPLIGSCNYAFTVILKQADFVLRDSIETELQKNNIEFRRGLSGGGNQLRQPYLRQKYGDSYKQYPVTEHIHHFSWYIGNYPSLERGKILQLSKVLNSAARAA